MTKFLTRYETQKEAPNYYTRDAGADAKRAVTHVQGSAAAGARHPASVRHLQAQRTASRCRARCICRPATSRATKVPVIMWAYPREFGDADSASQVTGSPNSLHARSAAPRTCSCCCPGYAIFDNPTMPIIGPGETANDTYVEQLVASAQAAVDKVVEMGVADRDRIGVGGHSYGGFMTANLLAHSRLFRAGFARERRLQPLADAVGLPERAPHVLGGAGHLRQDVAVLVRATRSRIRSC